MTDAIIEAAARALRESTAGKAVWSGYDSVAAAIVTAITPLIEANALERAAKVAEAHPMHGGHPSGGTAITPGVGDQIAAAIRALKEQPAESSAA